MIKLCALLKPDNILLGISASSKKRILELGAQTLSLLYHLDKKAIFDGLNARERLGSTYLGYGLAVPHCRMKDLDQPLALFIRLNDRLENNTDSEPIEAFFFLLVPEEETDEHLQILAQISEIFSDKQEREKLKEASTVAEFAEVINQWCAQHSDDKEK